MVWRSAPVGLVRVVPVGIVLLELGDQCVDVHRADVPADHPVDETGWLVEVGGAKLVYDMPTDAVPAIIELHESMLSGGAQVQLAP